MRIPNHIESTTALLLMLILTSGCQRTPPPIRSVSLPDGMDEGIPGLMGFTDPEAAIDSACETDLPLFIYFTGYQVGIGAERQAKVLSSPEITSMTNRHFVVLYQYVDDRRPDSVAELDTATGPPRTRGAECMEFERATFGKISQPYVGFMDPVSLETVGGFGYETDPERIMTTLENVRHHFENKQR